jgi:small conductance mechanosensitive channel
MTQRALDKQQLEPPVKLLLTRVVRLLLMLAFVLLALDTAGFPILTLIAGIGVAGIGVGLALQGVLSNLFAGLTIIFTKPFRVGEYIEVATVQGEVKHIDLFSTILLHPDMSKIVIPNHKIVGEILHNYGHIRQLSLTVGVGYGSNLSEVVAVVREIVTANARVLKTPAPVIGVSTLANSAINIAICPWTSVADFNPAQAEIYQSVVDAFRARNIEIPFPQHEVRLLNSPPAPEAKPAGRLL